jgi:hypothetical protein
MIREVRPEMLDQLPPEDLGAIGSRRDLRRVNALIGNSQIMDQALGEFFTDRYPESIVELGAGDGTSLLSLAKRVAPRSKPLSVTLVDRQQLLSEQTKAQFAALSWHVESHTFDVFDWLARPKPRQCDAIVATLFLHHFADEELRRLLALICNHTRLFAACEPRRAKFPLYAAGMLGFIGCNEVTRHDGKVSVRAGFAGSELSALWPDRTTWKLTERPAGLFTHCFVARRIDVAPAALH